MTEGKSSEPIISVVVPIYNALLYLESCLNSILDQHLSEDELEVIMVNDGSTDGSQLIAQKYAERYPSFHLINQPNGGLSAARNTGVKHAQGRYLHFLDSDDVLAPNAYRDRITILERTGSDFITSLAVRFSKDYHYWVFARTADLLSCNQEKLNLVDHPEYVRDFLPWNKIYRRSFFVQTNVKFPEGRIFEDVATSPKLYLAAKSFDVYNKALVYYRVTKNSITQTRNAIKSTDRLWAIETVKQYLVDKHVPNNLMEEFDFAIIDYNLRWIFLDLHCYGYGTQMEILQRISEIMQSIDNHTIDRVVKPLCDWAHMAKNRKYDQLLKILKNGFILPNREIGQKIPRTKILTKIKRILPKIRGRFKKLVHRNMQRAHKVLLYFVWYPLFRHLPLMQHTVMFSSYWGRQFQTSLGTPAVAVELSKYDKKYKIIVCAQARTLQQVTESATSLLGEDANVEIVVINTMRYYWYFWRAKYLFNDVNFGTGLNRRFLKKRSRQIEIQTTHGILLKKMGLDSEVAITKNQRAIFLEKTRRYDYLVASSPMIARRVQDCNGVNSTILKTGLPQNDFLFKDFSYEEMSRTKEKYGIAPDKKTVLYAPTYRYGQGYAFRYLIDFWKLHDLLGASYQILIKTHPFNCTDLRMTDFRELTNFGSGIEKGAAFIDLFGEINGLSRHCRSVDLDKLQWNYYPRPMHAAADINELMLISDMMVTDYSSTVFNYPHLNKPLILFIPDVDFYNSTRGIYDNIEQIAPGAVTKTTEELANAIKLADNADAWSAKYDEKITAFKEAFLSYETGNASREILEEVGILKAGDVNGGDR